MSDLYFPRSLKPVVSKGYSMTRRNNVWSVDLAGGGVRQGRDTYYDVFPISVTLITSALGRQAFLSFLEKVDGGASSFWMAHDFGMGIEDYQVTITSTIAESTEDGINWTITFTATAEKSPFQDEDNLCFVNNLPDLYGCYGDRLGSFMKIYGIYATTFPRVWEPNVIAQFNADERLFRGIGFARASDGTYVEGSLIKTAAANIPRYESDGLLLESGGLNLGVARDLTTWGPRNVTTTAVDSYFYTVIENTVDGTHNIGARSANVVSGVLYTVSMLAKRHTSGVKRWLAINVGGSAVSAGHRITFDLDDGSFTLQNSPVSGRTTRKGDYWLCEMQILTVASGSLTFGARLSDRPINALNAWLGDGVSGIVCGAPQIEAAAMASSYMPSTGSQSSRSADILTLTVSGAKRVYREYTPLGSTTAIIETVPYTGELCPPGHVRVIKVLND